MKSSDNTIKNLQQVERYMGSDLHLVAFILDPFLGERTLRTYQKQVDYLSGKIVHFTISPNVLTAKEVAEGAFDKYYTQFFEFVKKNNLKVIFRTMHEMNGNRYPWSGDPYWYKQAWTRVWHLSRKAGLDQQYILFDFSVNHWDVWGAGSVRCTLGNKAMLGCQTWEDYWPGDMYVDLMGFTFYNRGTATSNRRRLWPEEILHHDGAGLLGRLQEKGKPLIIDEVGTTAVFYDGGYNRERSVQTYGQTEGVAKNQRLRELAYLARAMPQLVGLVYFNVDYTYGLTYEIPNEADWLIVSRGEKRYLLDGVQSLLINQAKPTTLSRLFGAVGSGTGGGMHGAGDTNGVSSGGILKLGGIKPGVIKKTKLSWRSVQGGSGSVSTGSLLTGSVPVRVQSASVGSGR